MSEQAPPDRAPPYDEEAERSLLGSVLLDHEACHSLLATMEEKHFYHPLHKKILCAIRQLYEEAKPIDPVLVHQQLLKNAEKDVPADYLISLMEAVPSPYHAEHYFEIVKDKSILREVIGACTQLLQECYSQYEEAEKLVDRAGEILMNLSMQRVSGESVPLNKVLQDTLDRIEKLRQAEIAGLRTGYHVLDKMTSGLQNSELTIIAGRPSMGKTSLAMNIASYIGVHLNVPVGIFSLEVNKVQLAQNMLCAELRVDAQRVRTGQINKEEHNRIAGLIGRLADAPVFIQDSSTLTISELRAQARRLKHEHQVGAIFIDYLQLMEASRQQRGYEGRVQEISTISRGLKSIARELDIPVVALSQLSRQVESREGNRPRMSDLRESGSIEQDADVIMLLYREGYYKQDEESRKAEIILAKQRNGPTGSVDLVFNREFLRFDNPTAEDIVV